MRACALVATAAVALLISAPAALGAAPLVDSTVAGSAGADGWFRGPVTIKWIISGETFSDAGCLTRTITADTKGTQITCTATNGDGSTTGIKTIKIDQTPPSGIAALPARPPDAAPWYNAPVALSWSGADATSGIAACTTMTYAGPEGPAVGPTGTCRDVAGNVSTDVAFPLAYDATAPTLTDLAATVAGRTATVRWTPAADGQQVTVARQPGDGGAPARTVLDAPGTARELIDGPLTPGIAYTWTATLRDAAGNATTVSTTATIPVLTAAQATTSADGTIVLRWRARPQAKYYNIQLFRGSRMILSAWPTRPRYAVKRTWRFQDRAQRLTAGRYRWFVWPGYGPRARHRYGRLLAHGRITAPKAPARSGAR